MSGMEIADAIRQRRVSSVEAVEAHIRQIERVNPVLNAVVADRFDLAREEAKKADARLATVTNGTELGVFHGVPCTIKESFALTGMPFTAGLVARKGIPADRDAAGVARLRAAGAIPLGVTNLSELCMWMESDNRVYGRSNNPYDPRRTVGGSSGGEGAIVGAGGAPFGLGADIGGSIRMPAFFNGVFGHKPTGGLVENGGQYPLPTARAMKYLVTGPIARRAEDLAPFLRVLGGEVADPASIRIEGLTVLVVEDDGRIGVTADLRAAQRAAADALADRGAHVQNARFPALARSVEIWSAMLHAAGGPTFSSLLGQGTEIAAGWELLRWAFRRSPHTLPAIGLALLEKIPAALSSKRGEFIEMGVELRRELVERIGPRGVLLYPPHSRPAPLHYQAMFPPWNWGYTAILNVMEVPVTQVPLGLNEAGIPLGVQVVGVHGNDHVTLAVALELEKAFGGWVPPPLARADGNGAGVRRSAARRADSVRDGAMETA
jgi:fatty acid amide hydrolase 2